MNYLLLIIKGALIGIANIIPGVSGGTMAVSFGIYDDLISSISNFFKDWKKSLKLLIPLGIGLALGIVFFSYVIEILLSKFTLPTALAFVGLILGGMPILINSFKESLKKENLKINWLHILLFIIFIAIVVLFSVLQEPQKTFTPITLNPINIFILFFIGIIASATMVIPGISGSLVLMILGYYYGIINTLTDFFSALRNLDINAMVSSLGILLPFGIGILLGIFLISKAIDLLFTKFPSFTYSAILGLIIASPFALIYNTNSFAGVLSTKGLVFSVVGIALCALCFFLTYALGKTSSAK